DVSAPALPRHFYSPSSFPAAEDLSTWAAAELRPGRCPLSPRAALLSPPLPRCFSLRAAALFWRSFWAALRRRSDRFWRAARAAIRRGWACHRAAPWLAAAEGCVAARVFRRPAQAAPAPRVSRSESARLPAA